MIGSLLGTLASSINSSKNSIDLVFITYWLPSKEGARVLIEKDFQCINEKLKKAIDSKGMGYTVLRVKQC